MWQRCAANVNKQNVIYQCFGIVESSLNFVFWGLSERDQNIDPFFYYKI